MGVSSPLLTAALPWDDGLEGKLVVASLPSVSLAFVVPAAICYGWAFGRARGSGKAGSGAAWCFGIGLTTATLATVGPVGAYAPVLFWVRALQVLLLLPRPLLGSALAQTPACPVNDRL